MFRRRIRAFIISCYCIICCVTSVAAGQADDIKIVASFYPVYITAKNVLKGVPGVSIHNLTPPLTGCLHDYTVTTEDMKKLAGAQVFVANGAGMEAFLDKVISRHPDLKIIELSQDILLIADEKGSNPHVWVSISNAIIQAKNFGKAMGELDPAHKELYAGNTDNYIARLEALKNRMHSELAPYQGRQIITFHEAFPYFAKEFGFNIAAVVEREPGSQPSAKELADTIEIIKKNDIAVLFSEPQYPSGAARVIAGETGSNVYVLDPAATGPDDYDAYINIMDNNLTVLKAAFSKK